MSLLRAWMKAGTRQIVATLDSLGRARAHLHSHIPVENNPESSPNQKCIILPDILKSSEGPGNLPTQGWDPHILYCRWILDCWDIWEALDGIIQRTCTKCRGFCPLFYYYFFNSLWVLFGFDSCQVQMCLLPKSIPFTWPKWHVC